MNLLDAVQGRFGRKVLLLTALLLTLLLIVLIIALILVLRPGAPAEYPAVAEIRPLHILQGPGVGSEPFFDAPMGAAFGKDGRIYVADTGNNRVVVFDSEAQYLFQFGGLGVAKPAPGGAFSWQPGLFNYPTDVATDDHGNVYVADFRNDQIQVFDADGAFLRTFPDRTKQVGRGSSGYDGTGIAVTSVTVRDDRVYATDKYQVLVFDLEGELLSQFGRPGTGPTDLNRPNGIAVGTNGIVIVSDSNHKRVIAMTPAGTFLWSVGAPLGDATKDVGGVFEVPRGVAETSDGGFVIADALASKIVKLSATGEMVGSYGQRGDAPGELNFPTDVDAQGDRRLIAEKGNNRVQVVVITAE